MRIADEIARLKTMPLAELRERWVKLTGGPAPKVGTAMLRLVRPDPAPLHA